MKTQYKTEEYQAMKGLICLLIFSFLLIALLINFVIWFKASFLIFPAIACIFLWPYLFEKKVKALFTKSVLLEFDDVSFSITQYHKKNTTISKQLHFPWTDIKSYNVYFSPAKNTILTLHLRNGFLKRWNFKDNKTSEEAINGESLFKTFYSFVKQYNLDKDDEKKIALGSGFLNSKLGTAIIYFQITILIFAFIFHLSMHPQSSILTLFVGLSITLQQYFKRKNEKKVYDKIIGIAN